MALRIRRGTEPQRTGVTLEMGEIVWTTDAKQLWVGDGLQPGGYPVVGENVAGFGLAFNASSKRLEVAGLTTNDIPEGTNNKYFSTDLAQDAAALLFSTGSHTGITFQYDDTLGAINAVVTLDVGTSDSIRELAQDSVWTMLRDGTHSNVSFTYTDNGAATGTINATVTLDGTGIASVSADLSPSLGGNLSLNSRNITGTGNINITGDITGTGKLDNGVISIDNDLLTSASNNFIFGTVGSSSSVKINTNDSTVSSVILTGLASGAISGTSQEFRTSRGSILAPAALQLGDAVGLTTAFAYDGSDYQISTLIGSFIDPNGSISAGSATGMIGLVSFSDSNPANVKGVFVNRKGWLTVGRTILDDALAELDVNGDVNASLYLAGQQTGSNDFTNGYSFSGTEGGNDTGMFSAADGILKLVSNTNTVVTVNSNKTITLAVLTAAPSSPAIGTIAVADGTSWDPATVGGLAYPVFYNGSTWIKMFS